MKNRNNYILPMIEQKKFNWQFTTKFVFDDVNDVYELKKLKKKELYDFV